MSCAAASTSATKPDVIRSKSLLIRIPGTALAYLRKLVRISNVSGDVMASDDSAMALTASKIKLAGPLIGVSVMAHVGVKHPSPQVPSNVCHIHALLCNFRCRSEPEAPLEGQKSPPYGRCRLISRHRFDFTRSACASVTCKSRAVTVGHSHNYCRCMQGTCYLQASAWH